MIERAVNSFIKKLSSIDVYFPITEFHNPFLEEHVKSIRFCFDDENNITDKASIFKLIKCFISQRRIPFNVKNMVPISMNSE